MSPALTAPSSEGCLCASCMMAIGSGALKCTKCQTLVHVTCSQQPLYQLIRYATSGAQYCCVRCCKSELGEEQYEDEAKSLNELIEREQEIKSAASLDTSDAQLAIEPAGESAERSGNPVSVPSHKVYADHTDNMTRRDNSRVSSSNVQQAAARPKAICKF